MAHEHVFKPVLFISWEKTALMEPREGQETSANALERHPAHVMVAIRRTGCSAKGQPSIVYVVHVLSYFGTETGLFILSRSTESNMVCFNVPD